MSSKKPYEVIDSQSVKRAMKEFAITSNTLLCNELGLDNGTVSKLLNNEKKFTDWHKRTFYYFFKSKELQRQLKNTPKHTNKSELIEELIKELEKLKDIP